MELPTCVDVLEDQIPKLRERRCLHAVFVRDGIEHNPLDFLDERLAQRFWRRETLDKLL